MIVRKSSRFSSPKRNGRSSSSTTFRGCETNSDGYREESTRHTSLYNLNGVGVREMLLHAQNEFAEMRQYVFVIPNFSWIGSVRPTPEIQF
jgi:hypothetical protein